MQILLVNWRLDRGGGTEEWTHLMGASLRHLGHDVSLTDKPTKQHYDLAIINHLDPSDFNASKKIYTVHGIIPALELPKKGADVYVGVSEEIATKYGFEHVIRNPIDLNRFTTQSKVNPEPQNILAISNNPLDEDLVREATKGWSFQRIGGNNRVKNPEKYIEWADVVITLGRGCYESMAMNRNVLVYDYNGGDGMITHENYYHFRQNNCSGRYNGFNWTAEELRWQIEGAYDSDPQFRQHIEKHHDPIKVAEEYLAL